MSLGADLMNGGTNKLIDKNEKKKKNNNKNHWSES